MNSSHDKKGGVMSTPLAQRVAVSLGLIPLEPALPHAQKIRDILRSIETAMATDEYELLAVKREQDLITPEEFGEAFNRLLAQVQ